MDIVNHSGEHLLALIDDILEMSKIEAGCLERCDTNFELEPFLENLQSMLQLKTHQKGLTVYPGPGTCPSRLDLHGPGQAASGAA